MIDEIISKHRHFHAEEGEVLTYFDYQAENPNWLDYVSFDCVYAPVESAVVPFIITVAQDEEFKALQLAAQEEERRKEEHS